MSGYSFDRSSKKVPLIQTEFRKIQTSIPVEGTETILSELDRYESRSMHGQLPIVWDKAVDSCIFDAAGNQWIDFTSTIFVTNIGHSNPHLISSLKDTLDNENLVASTSSRVPGEKTLSYEENQLLSLGEKLKESGNENRNRNSIAHLLTQMICSSQTGNHLRSS